MVNPLKPEHCTTLDCVIQSATELADLLNKCQQCQLDVEQAIKQNQQQLQLATDLKRTFFPTSA